jgi:hypothetical protein
MNELSYGEQKSLTEKMIQMSVNKWLLSEGIFLQLIRIGLNTKNRI